MTKRTWKDICLHLKTYLPETYISSSKVPKEIERKAREQIIDEIMSMYDEVDLKVILQICKNLKKNKLED